MKTQSPGLKSRLVTGLVLALILLILIGWLPPLVFAVVSALVFGWVAYEYACLINFHSGIQQVAFIGIFWTICAGLFYWPILWLNVLALLGWGGVLYCLLGYPRLGKLFYNRTWVLMLWGWVLLAACWNAIWLLRQRPEGRWDVLSVLLIVSVMDIGAYFSGRAWGQRHLLPKVSPGKTWAGLAGGLVGSIGVGLMWGTIIYSFDVILAVKWVVLVAATALISVEGDLFESLVKRLRGVKDSGTCLPGHGGILDRVDSLLPAAPFFWFFLTALFN